MKYFYKNFFGILKSWLPLAVVTIALCGLIYVSVQQNYRMSANDPQIQIAEDISEELSSGQNPQFFIPARKIDLSKSLSTFIIVYDANGKIIGGSAKLDGKDPEIPNGVFQVTKDKKETRFTWQPKEGVREALVVKYFEGKNKGFVAIGRSLREVEVREDNLTTMIFIGLLITLFSSFASLYIFQKKK